MKKRREIYARFGVQLRNNRRCFKAEKLAAGSFGLYCFCVLDTRAELLDGFIAEEVLLGALGRPHKERLAQAEALCEVDLLERVAGGYRVIKYEEHNDTASEVEEAKAAALKRQNKKRHASEPPGVTRDNTVSHAGVPISISISSTSSGSSSLGEGLGEGPPEWFGDAARTVSEGTGREVTDLHGRWLEYRASRERKNWAMNARDAVGWLTAVMRTEARQPKARGAEATKQPYDENAPWMKLPEVGDGTNG